MDHHLTKDQTNLLLLELQEGEIDLRGQFLLGSNYTFLAHLHYQEHTLPVVYKPRKGERPLWDFPTGTLTRRETAAFIVSEALGWNFVPPTVYRRKGPLGPGSLQLFIEHDPEYHYFNFSDADRERLRPVAAFDFIINNADRKGGHILRDPENRLWLIDHGICFHVEDKLRTVLWDFAGQEIPQDLLADMQNLLTGLNKGAETFEKLRPLLRVGEITSLAKRTRALITAAVFPHPGSRRPFPWPPI